MSLIVALSLWLAPAEVGPAPTVWAEAGGRPWTMCRDHERQADSLLQRVSQRADETQAEVPWAQRARDCPGAPAVLVLAAMRELFKLPSYPPLVDLTAALPRLAEAQRQTREQARAWLQQALAEAQRRGEPPPVLTYYFLAYAALGLGEPAAARAALAESERRGEVESHLIDRAAAVAALLAGDLQAALDLAYRGRELAPASDRQTAVYLLALVYDRAGAPDAAMRELAALRPGGFGFERGLVDTLLPLHERLYLNALEHKAQRNPNNATRLWEAYLASPEPEAPERTLAQQRLAELRPRGSVVPTSPGKAP